MTGHRFDKIGGLQALVLSAEGPPILSERDATDIIAETYGQDVDLVVIPLERVTPAFLDLRSGLLGAVVQKFANYRLRAAFIGDISDRVAASKSLHDFVFEANAGGHLLFVPDMAALMAMLETAG